MGVLTHFLQFALEILAIFAVTPLDRESGFTEVIAQIGVAGAGHAGFVGGEVGRTGLAPLEPSELSHFGLVIVEALRVAKFGQDASCKDGAKAGDGLQRVGDGGDVLGNGGVQPFFLVLQSANLLQTEAHNEVDRQLQSWREWVRI